MLNQSERELVSRLLSFVSWPSISSARKVEKNFENIPGLTGGLMSYEGDLIQPRKLQVDLRKTLADIVSGRVKQAIDDANQALVHFKSRIGLTAEGEIAVTGGLFGVDAVAWYGIALIIDRKRGMRERLTICGAPGCGKFILVFGRGRPQRYCSQAHRRAADKPESKKRSQRKRDVAKAEKFFGEGKSTDFVEGRIQGLSRDEIDRIEGRVKARSKNQRSRSIMN